MVFFFPPSPANPAVVYNANNGKLTLKFKWRAL